MAHSQRQEKDFNAFLNRLTVYCGSTNFLDGYILAAIGPALVHLGPILNLNLFWTGAIGAGSLIGILVGGPIFGYVSDKVGRKLPFMVIPIAMAILSILSIGDYRCTGYHFGVLETQLSGIAALAHE